MTEIIRTIEQMEEDQRPKVIVDVREPDDFSRGSYPGAVNISSQQFETVLKDFAGKVIYIIGYQGKDSLEIAEAYKKEREIYCIADGYPSYVKLKQNRMLENEEQIPGYILNVERSIIKKYRREIWHPFVKAINDYDLIEDGDKIAVCISGGKDSMLMAKCFQELKKHGKKQFDLVFLMMDPGYNPDNYQIIMNNTKLLGIPLSVFHTHIFEITAVEKESPCYLCARMRRGHLYNQAKELGCNKIALGHHFDDIIETIVMGMFYGAQIQTMMPKLHSLNFDGMELIRPMYLIREKNIIRWAASNGLNFIQCACRITEKSAIPGKKQGSKRDVVKKLIHDLAKKDPLIEMNIFRSVENVNLGTIIAYKKDGKKHYFLEDYDQE